MQAKILRSGSILLPCVKEAGKMPALQIYKNGMLPMVVVDGIDDTGKILIRDPWNATKYKMDREEFLNYWNIQAIYSINR